MPRSSRYPGLWLTLALALCCRQGAAEPGPSFRLAFEYEADPTLECPSVAEMRASISQQLGYDPFAAQTAEQRLRVNVTRVASRAEARIEWIDGQGQSEGERRLASDDPDCTALARSLAFAIAVQIQLHASATEPPRPAPPPAAPALPAPPAPPDKPRSPASSTQARRQVLLGAGAMVRSGSSPGVTPGLRIFGALFSERWSVELSGHATLPAELVRADRTGFTAQELGANLVPCVRFAPLGICAVGTLSLLRVRGRGVDRIGSPSSASGGAGARLQLLWPALERFGVLVQGEAVTLPARQDVLLNRAPVWSTAPVAFTAILDFAGIFP